MEHEKKSGALPLFCTFLKIGAFTFGGGYAMIPLIQREVVDRKHWISDRDILDIVAIAESTPGPIAINAATFIGYRTAGFWGAFCATLGVVLPSFAIILLISLVLRRFSEIAVVKYAFLGIRAGVLALILRAMVSMYHQSPKHVISYFIMGGAFLAVAVLHIHVLLVILACGLTGLVSSLAAAGREKR